MLNLSSKPVLIASVVGTLVGGAVIIKELSSGKKYDGPNTVEGKVVVITGANSGLGKATTLELAKLRARIVMACRDMKKCEEARQAIVLESRNKFVYCRPCDLSSFTSIREFVDDLKKEYPYVDILINNAGVMNCPKLKTKEGIELQLGVNYMGPFLLTLLLLDSFNDCKSHHPRIINVSSSAHKRGKINVEDLNSDIIYNPREAYRQSKLANLLFTKELSERLADTNITVNAVHPGVVDTGITRHMSFHKSWISSIILKPFLWPFVKTPYRGAQTILFAALDPSVDKMTGKYFVDCKEATPSEDALNKELSCWLWLTSVKWTKTEDVEPVYKEPAAAEEKK